ncbi:MAG: glycosyltransferase family 4 protein [Alphaproteobacteria bacterium]
MRVCILACKDLRLNTRIARQVWALLQNGHEVTVAALGPPVLAPDAAWPGGRYRFLDLTPGKPPRAAASLRAWLLRKDRPADAPPPVTPPADNHVTAVKPSSPSPGRVHRGLATLLVLLRLNGARRFARRALGAIRRDRGREGFDIVQAHDELALMAAQAVCDRLGGRIIYDAVERPHEPAYLPDHPLLCAIRQLEQRREVAIIRRAAALITVGQGLAQRIAEDWQVAPPLVLRNCRRRTEIVASSAIREDCALGPDDRLLLYLNSIRPGQGLEELAAALAKLPDKVHLAVLGPVIDRAVERKFLDQVDARGAGKRVHMLALRHPEELLAYIAGADIGVLPRQNDHPNHYLSLPNRLFEMITARLPVAASRLPDIAGLVREYGIGEIFDETSPEDIARAIRVMIGAERYPRYKAAVDLAARDLVWENEVTKYLALLDETCGRAGAATGRPVSAIGEKHR